MKLTSKAKEFAQAEKDFRLPIRNWNKCTASDNKEGGISILDYL